MNIKCILPQGIAGAAHKRAALETPQFSQCFHKQNSGVSSGCVRANGVQRISFTAADLLPWRNPRAREMPEHDLALAAQRVQPSITPQAGTLVA